MTSPSAPLDTPPRRVRADSLPAAALLVALSALAPFSVDMFLPSMPTMRTDFHASDAVMSLAVTLFIVAFAGSQLVYGPASDRLGRRPVLLAGLSLFVAGGLVCYFAASAPVLVAGRVVQGLGGGAGPAVAQAIVLDVYGRDRAARVIAYMSIALPLAPAVSPIVGGFLHDAFGWHAVFVTLVSLGVVLGTLYLLLLPETRRAREGAAGVRGLLADYRSVLSSRTYLVYALLMGLNFSGQLVFISMSSFVLIDRLGLSARAYGFAFGAVAIGLMTGATLSSRLVARTPLHRIVRLGVTVAASGAAVMLLLALAGFEHVATVLAPMCLTAIGLGLARPSAIAGAIVPFPHIAGLASSVIVFAQMVIASSYNIAYGALFPATALALAGGIWFAVTLGLLSVLTLRPGED